MEDVYYEDRELAGSPGNPYELEVQSHYGHRPLAQPHYHDFIEILYGQAGSFEAKLGEQCYTIQAGDMLIIHSQEVHRTLSTGGGYNQFAVVKFVPELLFSSEQTALEMQYLMAFTLGVTAKHRFFSQEDLYSTFLPELVDNLFLEQANKEYGYEIAIRIHLCRLFLWILRRWHELGIGLSPVTGVHAESMRQIQQIFDYVEFHYGQKIHMEEMASMLNMSYSAFSKFFTRHTNLNFTDYLNGVRITKSKIMLATTTMSITEIAMEAGFSTTSYFIQCFKARNRITPQQFRMGFSIE